MNLSKSPYRDAQTEQLMQETLLHLADAHRFYLQATRNIADLEVRNAFGFAADVHARLLHALRAVLPAQAFDPDAAETPAFAQVAVAFDGRAPERSAAALHAFEVDLMHRIEALFANYPDMRVRAVLKRHVLAVQRTADTARRLAQRNAA